MSLFDINVKVSVDGEKKLIATFGRYQLATRRHLAEAVRLSTLAIRRRARARAPVETGELRRSVGLRKSNDGLTGSVRVRVRYAAPVEFGTAKRVAKHFLYPEYDAELPIFQRRVIEAVTKTAPREAAMGGA